MNNSFPYPGLRPFEQNETDIFFGREDHIDQLLEKLGQTRFLAIVGPSGCGKSSLARAGLLACLKAGFLSEAGIHWRIAEMRPGNSPYANLAQALLEESILGNAYATYSTDDTNVAFLQASLSRGPFSLHEIFANTPLPSDTHLLILVDQFEEIFRYYEHDKDNVNEATAFVSLLLTTAQHTRAPTHEQENTKIYVVITMRGEYLRDCAIFHGLPEAINQGIFLPPRLTRDQLREAIELPAQVFGAQVEPALVNQLLNKVSNDQDQLPVLQHALMRMWRLARAENPEQAILTLKHYDKIGGLEKALSQHAEKAYAKLVPAQQKIAETLFRNLTGANNTRRPMKLAEMATLAKVSCEQVVTVVEIFRQEGRSFLIPPLGKALTPETILDISHESFIRLWQRLKDWTDDEAESAKIYRRLEDSAYLWNQGQAALWRDQDLEIASAWYKEKQPNAHWAKRYGQNFELAMRFLSKSKRKQQFKKIGIITAVGLFFLASSLFGAYFYSQWQQTEQLKQKVEQTETKRTSSLFDSHLTHASLLARIEDYAQAKQVLSKTYELEQKIPAPRRHTHNLLAWFTKLMGGESQQVYKGANAPLFDVAVSPDGSLLAAVGEKGTVVLFDVQSGELLHRLPGHEKNVYAVVFHPDGKWLATAGEDKTIIISSLPVKKSQKSINHILKKWQTDEEIYALAIRPDGSYLASSSPYKGITIWNTETGKTLPKFKDFAQYLPDRGIAFTPSGELLGSASSKKKACLWEIKMGQCLSFMEHEVEVKQIAFAPNENLIATSSGHNVYLWKINNNKWQRIVSRGHKGKVVDLHFIANGQQIVSSSEDQTLRIWDTETGVTLRILQGHTGTINGIALYTENIFSASTDGTIKRWNTVLPFQQIIDLPSASISSAIAPDGKQVAIGFKNGALRLYSLPKADLLWEQEKAHQDRIRHLIFNSDGTQLATASFDKTAKLWQVEDNQLKEQHTFSSHTNQLYSVAFSHDSRMIATSDYNGQIHLFNVNTKQEDVINAHKGLATSVFFHTNGKLLSTGEDGLIQLWNIKNKQATLLSDTKDNLTWATFSPDGQQITSVGRKFLIHVYSTNNHQVQPSLVGHKDTIYRAIFSPDSQQIATVSADRTIRLWDLKKGTILFSLQLPINRGGNKDLRESSVYDFDFHCTYQGCLIVVPLIRNKLLLYQLGKIYDFPHP